MTAPLSVATKDRIAIDPLALPSSTRSSTIGAQEASDRSVRQSGRRVATTEQKNVAGRGQVAWRRGLPGIETRSSWMSERGLLYKTRRVIIGVITLLLNATASAAGTPVTQYAIVGRIPGPPDVVAWDYATIDSRAGRLYVATLRSRSATGFRGGITAVDLRSGKVTASLVKDAMPHEVVILNSGVAAAADAANNSVLFFNKITGRIVARVHTGESPNRNGWHDPDSLLRDPETPLIIAVNHDSGTLVLVNLVQHSVVGRIRVGGVLEAGAAGAHGTVFVNIASKGAIAVVNVRRRRLVRELPMNKCREPTGIAFDRADRLIISVCSNGIAKFIDADSGTEIAGIPVGKGADGVSYDNQRRVAFIAGGLSGTLSVIRVTDRHDIALIQSLRIPIGTRLGALDEADGRLYLPSARYDLSAPRLHLRGLPPLPRVVPGSFALLVVRALSKKAIHG